MKKLVLLTAALLISGQAGAYAQSADNPDQHATVKHKRIMAAHAHYRSHEGSIDYRSHEPAPTTIGPSYGDDPEANGRTSGGM
jgi:hypothetical protein